MSAALLRPQPLPLERLRPGVGLLVFAFHLGLLWVANLYWPLQSALFDAVQTTAQSITVQILQKPTDRSTSPDNNAALSANPQAISNPGRQRFGRSEAMLDLPAAQTEASTPLAGTVQFAQAAPPVPSRPVAAAVPPPVVTSIPAPPETQARPVPQAVSAPEPVPTPVVRTIDEKLPTPVPTPPTPATVPTPVQPPAAITTPPPSPLHSASPPPATAAAPPAAPAAPSATLAPASVAAAPAVSPSPATVSPAAAPSNPGSATASGPALASGSGTAVPGPGSSAAPVLSLPGAPGAGAPLNLNLPPRYIYRPPIAVPRRSLSEMANEQLRRKPRDPFAEGIESAGNIDCLKEAPEGPAQGLLAIGPLLKRAIEEKCRK